MNVEVSTPFEAVFGPNDTGLVGTVEVAVQDGDGNTVIGPTTNNITEESVGGTPTGIYTWNAPAAPPTVGQYTIIWSPDGTWDPETNSSPDELTVFPSGTSGVPPPIALPGGPGFGPATAWTTSEAVAECCDAEVGTGYSVFDDFVGEASQVLFELSGRLYIGLDSKTVRPLCRPGCPCGQVLSRGHIVQFPEWSWDWWCTREGPCDPSKVLLSGYPVREITEVKIDGVVLGLDEYRLDGMRWAVRKNNEVWPRCQNLSLDDDEVGTWAISYTYGQEPPLIGQSAAAELACQLYQMCYGDGGDCEIPATAVRVTRQGLTIDKNATINWFFGRRGAGEGGGWATGMPRVDMFLNAFNEHGLQQRPRTWSPDMYRYAKVVGS